MNNRNKWIGIIGLGYVGLPLAKLFVDNDYSVLGIDLNPSKISALQQGKSYISDLTDEQVQQLMQSEQFRAVTDYSDISLPDVFIICVPTPLNSLGHPDLSYIQQSGIEIAKQGLKGQLVILESSTYPGTTEEILLPILEDSGLQVGRDFNLAYSPERINPGDKNGVREKMPKIISGVTDTCLQKISDLYSTIFEKVVPVSTTRTAEMAKVMENSQRFINLSFVNDMMKFCHKMNIDIWEVIDAINTKPYGNLYFYPGPGIGGHCIPVDPLYLEWKSNQLGEPQPFLQNAKSTNDSMPEYIVNRLLDLLPGSHAMNEKSLLLLGLTYKKDVNDLRESRSYQIMKLLHRSKAKIFYHDPLIPEITTEGHTYYSVDLTDDFIEAMDSTIILTDHSSLPLEQIVSRSRLLFDTRNITKSFGSQPHIFRL